MSSAQDISHVVKNPPACLHCPEQKLVVTSQSMVIDDMGISSVVNAGCGVCGTLYEVSLTGIVLGEHN